MQSINEKPNLEFPARAKKLLASKNYESELAYWFVDSIDHMTPRLEPTQPNIMLQVNLKTLKEPRKFLDDHPEVEAYLKQVDIIKVENGSNLYWLVKAYRTLPEKDLVNRGRVMEAIMNFKGYSITEMWDDQSQKDVVPFLRYR